MDLRRHVEQLRGDLAAAAEAGDEATRAVAERLAVALEPAVRLALLDALSTAAAELTSELAPGRVDVRLRGLDPELVVTLPPGERRDDDPVGHDAGDQARATPPLAVPTDDATSRLNLRVPESLKARVEDAAGREGLSVNTWAVRTLAAALDGERPARRPTTTSRSGGHRLTGWVR